METSSWSSLQDRYRGAYKEVCKKLGLTYEEIDSDGYLLRISDPRRSSSVLIPFSDWVPLNSVGAARIARDKVLTKELLRSRSIAIPRGDHFFLKEKGDWKPESKLEGDAIRFANDFGYPLFVKPHDLSRGEGAQKVNSEVELVHALGCVREISHVAIVEECLSGKEGRIMCIDGEVQFMYHKEADPKTQIANLSAGGKLVDFQIDRVPSELSDLGEAVYDAFEHDLRFFAVDFFETSDGIVVLEVNHNPAMTRAWDSGHDEVVRGVFAHALEMYFREEFLRPNLSLPIMTRTNT